MSNMCSCYMDANNLAHSGLSCVEAHTPNFAEVYQFRRQYNGMLCLHQKGTSFCAVASLNC